MLEYYYEIDYPSNDNFDEIMINILLVIKCLFQIIASNYFYSRR